MAQWICRKSQQKHNQEGPIILNIRNLLSALSFSTSPSSAGDQEGPIILNIRNLLSALSFSTSPSSAGDGVLLLYDIRMRCEIFSSYRKTLANEDTENRYPR